jgi:hypothetical protein
LTAPDPKAAAVRFGILRGGAALESWQIRCLEQLAALSYAHAAVSIAPACPSATPQAFAASTAPTAPAAPCGPWGELPNIPVEISAEPRAAAAFTAESLARLRDARLDFILCFADATLPVEVLQVPRLGIWRYHWGDWTHYRGSRPGFWEVFDHCPVSAALLVRLCPDPDVVHVLREGYVRTHALSAHKNREQLFMRFTHWPAQVCREISTGRVGGGASTPRRGGALRAPPTAWQRTWLVARIAIRAAGTGFRSLFRHDQWNVGIIDLPIEQMLTAGATPHVDWLPATPRAEFRADPFGTSYAGRETILYEHFSYCDNIGYIVAMDAKLGAPGARVQIGPEQAVHLSYPFLFEVDGRLLCVPESSAAGEIALYEAERFPDRWKKAATLIAGRGFADATLFQHEGRWWMAASDVAEKGANSELYLWFAAAPAGPWQEHPGNPVKTDVRSARPAGAPFRVDGVLYRPAQDCSSSYGARVSINRILALTPDEFREEVVTTVNPDPRGKYPAGLHTLSRLGARTLVDGKRSVFAAAEFFRVARHYLG